MRTWQDNKNLLVINLFAGPGVGKTCLSYDLTSLLNKRGYDAELTGEYAKTMLWNRQFDLVSEQDFIFAQQHHLQRRFLNNTPTCIVSDSPLCLGLLYTPDDYPKSFTTFVMDAFNSYTNFNVLLTRNPNLTYQQFGRFQNAEEAAEKDQILIDLLRDNNVPIDLMLTAQDGNEHTIIPIVRDRYPQFFNKGT